MVLQTQQQLVDLLLATQHLRQSQLLEQQYASRLNQVVSNLLNFRGNQSIERESLTSKLNQTAALHFSQLLLMSTKIVWPPKQDLKLLFKTASVKRIIDLPTTELSLFLQVFCFYFGVELDRELEIAVCLDKYSLQLRSQAQRGVQQDIIHFSWNGPRLLTSWNSGFVDSIKSCFTGLAPSILAGDSKDQPSWLFLQPGTDFPALTVQLDALINKLNPILISFVSATALGSSELLGLHVGRVLIESLRGSPTKADGMSNLILDYCLSIGVLSLEDLCSIYVLKGLCMELKKELPDKYYLLALRLAIQIGGNPIARGSGCHPVLLFLVWRLGLRMRLAGLTQEYEFFDEVFDACLLELSRSKLTGFMDSYADLLSTEVKASLETYSKKAKNPPQDAENTSYLDPSVSDQVVKESSISITVEPKDQGSSVLKDWVNSMRVLSAEESPNLVAKTDAPLIGCPFSHWSSHRWAFKTKSQIAEIASYNTKKPIIKKKVDLDPGVLLKAKQEQEQYIINSLKDNHQLLYWLFENLPCFGPQQRKLWALNSVKLMLGPIEDLFKMEAFILSRELSDVGAILGTNLHAPPDPNDQQRWLSGSNETLGMERRLGITKAAKKEALDSLQKLIASFRVPMSEGSIYSWGSNTAGQLGNSASTEGVTSNLTTKPFTLYYPRTVLPLKNLLIRQVACGHMHTIAQLESGLLMSWGCNQFGKLGLGEGFPRMVPVPAPMTHAPRNTSMISCGNEHSAILTSDGKLFTWGQGEGGLLGHGDCESLSIPKQIHLLDPVKIIQISCGGLHTLALSNSHEVYSWGRGEGGQLGHEPKTIDRTKDGDAFITVPRVIESLQGHKILQITAGEAHSVCLDDHGVVRVWGFSSSGQLGNGASATDDNIFSTDMQVFCPSELKLANHKEVLQVYSGKTSTFIQTSASDVYGCGSNDLHQLGLPQRFSIDENHATQRTEVASPLRIDALGALGTVESLISGSVHSLAVCRTPDASQLLVAWGSNRQGQLGIGKQDPNGCLPTILRRFVGSSIKSVGVF